MRHNLSVISQLSVSPNQRDDRTNAVSSVVCPSTGLPWLPTSGLQPDSHEAAVLAPSATAQPEERSDRLNNPMEATTLSNCK